MSQLDYSLFQMINHLAVSDSFLNGLMEFLAEKAMYLFFIGLVVYWFYKKPNNRGMVIEAVIAACIALLISAIIGHFYNRSRPFVAHHVHQLIAHAKNASFPSDHATGTFVIATIFWIWKKRAGWVWLILAAAISLSRVWTGVHYPFDVIGGMIIGVSAAFFTHAFLPRWSFITKPINLLVDQYEKIENAILKKNKTV